MKSHSKSELHLDDIRPYLVGAKQKGAHVTATCPLCGKAGHLHIDEKNGTLLVYCQKCNASGTDILREFRRLGAQPTATEPVDYNAIKPIEDYRHIYRNPDGTESYYKRRRKWADGHKTFSFGYTAPDGRAVYTKPENCNNLYNLDLMEKHEQDVLYIVEGEKCADAMVKAGLLATTSNTGAQKNIKLSPTDKLLLESYPERIVIPDNDDKGADYAAAWTGAKIMDITKLWADCPQKGDIADYFASGGSAEAIRAYEWPIVLSLDRDFFESCDRFSLIDSALLEAIAGVTEPAKRQLILSMARFRAGELCCKREFESCWKAYLQQQAAKGIRSDNMTKFPQQLFALRCGSWSTSANGVYRSVQVGTEYKNEYASPIPIMPTELLVNVEDETEKIRLAYFKNGCWQSVVVPRSTVANKNKIVLLADNGVEVNSDNAGLLVKYLAETIALNPDILPRVKSIDHMGWSDAGFIPYTDEVKLDCEEQYKSLVQAVGSKGTLEEWVEYVSPLRQNVYMRLILAASFASVLIERVSALPFVLHLWGGTGSGKTVGMMVAASIWGNPNMGKLVRTMNMTVNSMMSTAAILRNLPFFGDELQTIKSRFESYDTLIMRVTEGLDRGRMTNSTFQRQKSWANSFIFTGEEPCTKSQSGGGVKNRVIEIECEQQIVANGNAVVNFISQHYGCAGKAFIEGLQWCELAKDYNEFMSLVLEETNTTEKQAMAMALILQADAIASSTVFGTPGDILTAEDVAKFVKSQSDVDVSERAFNIIADVIGANSDKFDTEFDDYSGHSYWGRRRSDGVISINKTVLEEELEKKGFDFTALKKKWAEAGYLIKNTQGRYYSLLRLGHTRANYVTLCIKC
ncbi:MAG: DUF927 domain-containing protein [Porphyromonas sp.]|nr:DUF927 domain-containing protein [Porphyromonas sp.]